MGTIYICKKQLGIKLCKMIISPFFFFCRKLKNEQKMLFDVFLTPKMSYFNAVIWLHDNTSGHWLIKVCVSI